MNKYPEEFSHCTRSPLMASDSYFGIFGETKNVEKSQGEIKIPRERMKSAHTVRVSAADSARLSVSGISTEIFGIF